MFAKARAVILNKIDLLEYTNFNRQEFYDDIASLNAGAVIFETSCTKDKGLDELCTWLKSKVKAKYD